MQSIEKTVDIGTGYGRKAPSYYPELTEVGPGTPMGELLRRYWHPVAISAEANETPRRVRILGEDLILFRDGSGRPGLVIERCTHRGASLFYGRVEDEGIRCCYHGWLFSAEGCCLDKAVEPDGGKKRDLDRQPWYPVKEKYGLIFAYMGRPEKKPVLPRYDSLEELQDGEFLEVDNTNPATAGADICDYNWLQHYENIMDPGHAPWLHFLHSGSQFGSNHRLANESFDSHNFLDDVRWDYSDKGMKLTLNHRIDGRLLHYVQEAILPTVRIVPVATDKNKKGRSPYVGWVQPIDDTHHRIYVAGRVTRHGQMLENRTTQNGKLWKDTTPEERQKYPADYEVQLSQGSITLHSAEHLSQSDRGITMLRRLFLEQLAIIKNSGDKDPINVSFDESAPPVEVKAGSFDAS